MLSLCEISDILSSVVKFMKFLTNKQINKSYNN